MFNLESELSKWKTNLLEKKSLTNEDIEELESHILDKVYDLQSSGYTLDEAFNIAKSDLGNAELLEVEYIKVNTSISIQQRIGYGVLGFVFINFMFEIRHIITIVVSSVFVDKLLSAKQIDIPIISDLIRIMVGTSYNNNLSLFAFLVSTILTIVIMYLIFLNKVNIITIYIETIERFKIKKLLNIILLVVIPVVLTFGTNIIFYEILVKVNIDKYGDIAVINGLVSFLSNLILFITFTIELSKNNRNNRFKLVALTGYTVLLLVFESIPISLNLILMKFGVSNFSLSFVIYVVISLLVIYYLGKSKSKVTLKAREFLEFSNKRVIFGVFAIILTISRLVLMPLYTRYFQAELIGNISYTICVVRYVTIVLLLCITCLSSIINNSKFNTKLNKRKYI